MPGREDRMKASEVFRTSSPAFSQKVPFETAFPEIEDVRVEVERGQLGSPKSGPLTYTRRTLSEYVDCDNPLCYNGGVSIGAIIRDTIAAKKSEDDVTKRCQGQEGSPKGRRVYRSCMTMFRVRLGLTYKPGKEPTPS
jgi:hypothetical protein